MSKLPALLIVDGDVLVRHHLAEYLRDCGFHVVEASSSEEALTFLREDQIPIEAVLADADIAGEMTGFELAQWVRRNCADTDVVLVGTLESAVEKAAGLCEESANLRKPYDPQLVLDRIKRLRAERERKS
jgi:DNA-binding response OmpR family regulator